MEVPWEQLDACIRGQIMAEDVTEMLGQEGQREKEAKQRSGGRLRSRAPEEGK